MTPRIIRLVAALVATAAVTACTITATGTPHAGSTSQPPSSTATTSAKEQAPRVTTPLDASTFVAAPCTTLTTDQLSPFAVNPPGDIRELEGVPTGCTWHGADGAISIGWLKENKGGLSDTYRGGRELNAYFIPTSVDGYPAVFVDAIDARASGRCSMVVAVSDTLTFTPSVDNGKLGMDESCAYAMRVAEAAIATIKAAN